MTSTNEEWRLITRLEFEEILKLNPYGWKRVIGEKKTRYYKKYSLWESATEGGLWVEDP